MIENRPHKTCYIHFNKGFKLLQKTKHIRISTKNIADKVHKKTQQEMSIMILKNI